MPHVPDPLSFSLQSTASEISLCCLLDPLAAPAGFVSLNLILFPSHLLFLFIFYPLFLF
jgi:hypothetical protein